MHVAFKEWAVICQALALGLQAIIVRKGGIDDGEFRLEHSRFWLYPTYLHQQEKGIKAEARELLARARQDRPPAGKVRLEHYVEVPGMYRVRDLAAAEAIDHLHVWSEETVRARFAYRRPGLNVLPARVWRVPRYVEIDEPLEAAGCKSWVELGADLPTGDARPVLDDAAFRDVLRQLDALLNPTAFA